MATCMYYVHIINVKNGILKFPFLALALFIRLFVSGVIRYTQLRSKYKKIKYNNNNRSRRRKIISIFRLLPTQID